MTQRYALYEPEKTGGGRCRLDMIISNQKAGSREERQRKRTREDVAGRTRALCRATGIFRNGVNAGTGIPRLRVARGTDRFAASQRILSAGAEARNEERANQRRNQLAEREHGERGVHA